MCCVIFRGQSFLVRKRRKKRREEMCLSLVQLFLLFCSSFKKCFAHRKRCMNDDPDTPLEKREMRKRGERGEKEMRKKK